MKNTQTTPAASESRHTPTPWTRDGYDIRQPNGGRMIGYFGPHHTLPSEYPKSCQIQDEANAQAAVDAVNATYGQGIAPEAVAGLVEALEMALRWAAEVPSPYREFPFIAAARAALAKARGEK